MLREIQGKPATSAFPPHRCRVVAANSATLFDSATATDALERDWRCERDVAVAGGCDQAAVFAQAKAIGTGYLHPDRLRIRARCDRE